VKFTEANDGLGFGANKTLPQLLHMLVSLYERFQLHTLGSLAPNPKRRQLFLTGEAKRPNGSFLLSGNFSLR